MFHYASEKISILTLYDVEWLYVICYCQYDSTYCIFPVNITFLFVQVAVLSSYESVCLERRDIPLITSWLEWPISEE